MTRLNLFAAALAAIVSTAHADTIVNLNATVPNGPAISGGGTPNTLAPSFYSTLSLAAGTYTVSAVGASTPGAVYSGWSYGYGSDGLAGVGSWSERVNLSTGGGSFSNAGGNDVYTAGNGDKVLFAGNYTNAAAALAANTVPYIFTLASTTSVTFYIPDNSYPSWPGFADNTGGVSLDLKPAAVTPEPSSLILLGTGALGVAGVMRRRFFKR